MVGQKVSGIRWMGIGVKLEKNEDVRKRRKEEKGNNIDKRIRRIMKGKRGIKQERRRKVENRGRRKTREIKLRKSEGKKWENK
jgi:hypothetical protein